MTDDFNIRNVAPGDFRALMAYDWAPLLRERDTIYLVMAHDQGPLSFVAEDEDGKPVGFLIASRSVDGSRAFVWHLHVSAACRARGLGMALLGRLEEEASRTGIRSVWLLTSGSTSAFYAKQGYSISAGDLEPWTEEYIRDVKKAVVMTKTLGAGK